MSDGIRVCTYNVLSSALATEESYPDYDPFVFNTTCRYQSIRVWIQEMTRDPNTILLLQEVSEDWAGKLDVLFTGLGYRFVYRLYGWKGSGYMGVGIAFPAAFNVETIKFQNIADAGEWPANDPPLPLIPKSWWPSWLWPTAVRVAATERSMALRKSNVAIFIRFGSATKSFCVATYHMPCAFKYPKIMAYHATSFVQWVQRYACSDPYVIGADFNFQPLDPLYGLLTTGVYVSDMESEFDFNIEVTPLRSAYAVMHDGKEPEMTNYSKFKDNPVFSGTLDYLFYGGNIAVLEAPTIPPLEFKIPSLVEPSDHVPVCATFRL